MNEGKEIEGWSVDGASDDLESKDRIESIICDADGIHMDVEFWGEMGSSSCMSVPLEVLRAVLDAVGFDLVKREP